MIDRQSAEEEIFALRKKIDTYARAGDVSEVARLQIAISHLQEMHGATKGAKGKTDNVTA